MWNWLRGHNDRRKDSRHRMERERDQRIQRELDDGVEHAHQRERYLLNELRRLERDLHRDGQ